MNKTEKEIETELFFYFVKGVFSGPRLKAKSTLDIIEKEFNRIESL